MATPITMDILRKMAPYFSKSLIPQEIVPKMNVLLTQDQRNRILELEEAGHREVAAKMLLDRIIEEGERGLAIFIHALRGDNEQSGWPKILKPLENSDGIDATEFASEYYAFLVHLLEGELIESMTEGNLHDILIHLYSSGAIDDFEMEVLEARLRNKGRSSTAVHMFSLLGMRDHRGPVKFFMALHETVPNLYRKAAPYDSDAVVDKEASENATSATEVCAAPDSLEAERAAPLEGQEETFPKQPLESQETQGGEPVPGPCVEKEDRCRVEDACHDRGPASSATAAETEEGERAGFSDDEKQDAEDSEKCHGRKAPKTHAPKDLALRNYQHELASEALKGTNTIICAPTGSGKTRVALHIVQKHLEGQLPGEDRKVVFLARTVPLVSQQHRNFKEYLPQYKCELVTGESENSMTVHHLLDKNKILVLTPKILENHLIPEKIPSLSAFSLIIFDECHHTRKGEPYNSVMKHYLKSKRQGEQGLPQIVGLTASIGVEKATTADEATESILSIMGNLDVSIISQVIENEGELRELVPRPEEDLETLESREDDEISNSISNVMLKIIEELLYQEDSVKTDSKVDEIHRLLSKRETDLKSQKFAQWAVTLRNQARLLQLCPDIPEDQREVEKIMKRQAFSRAVQVLADWLVAYNEAFDIHDLTRPEDVLHYLEHKSNLQRDEDKNYLSTQLDTKLLDYFTGVQKRLKCLKGQQNPNLEKLGKAITDHIEKEGTDDSGFRILVFVRTRDTCQALRYWLNKDPTVPPQLRDLKAQHFTGTGAHQEHGGMTPYEQVETLKRFKSGDVKLLVTTSVGEEGIDIAECNLTIRYNHVGNEVTTVQTRGRSRKRGGRSILMAMPKIIEQEELNRKREVLMNRALGQIRAMPEDDIREFTQKVQTKVLEVEEIDQIMKQVKKLKREADFSIACPKCYKVKVNGSKIRTINNAHRVIIGHEINKGVIIRPGNTILKKDDWEMKGAVVCKCKQPLGQLLQYKKANFILVSPKNWVFLDKDGMPNVYKKWTQVPHQIAEVSPADIKEHLGEEEEDQSGEAHGAAAAM